MFIHIIKYFPIIFPAVYICAKSSKSFLSLNQQLSAILLSICIPITTYYLAEYNSNIKHIFPPLIIWLFLSFISKNLYLSFSIAFISYGLSFCLHAISCLIIDIIFVFLFHHLISYELLAISAGILNCLLICSLLHIKRLRNGITFLTRTSIINLATLLCLVLISCLTLFHTSQMFALGLLIIILTLAFLIYWWQAQITKAYRRSLELRELESMRTEMAELKLLLLELTEENERLARIAHRDNTLISALKNATLKYLSTDYANPAAAMEVRNQLIENINSLSAERARMVDTHKENLARTFDTGISLLDELLQEMDEKAQEMNVIFAVHMGTSLENFIPKDISESDLVHTVDDLLKNAFKATASCEKRIVQLQFYKLGKHLVIEVADNGIPFEVKSLVNMGVEKLTTYEDGSGIGLMDIWSTKEKYGATYHLEECVNPTPFTKKISLTFDKKNRYSIRTLRKDEILQASRRADLQVYDFSE